MYPLWTENVVFCVFVEEKVAPVKLHFKQPHLNENNQASVTLQSHDENQTTDP